MPSYSLHTQSYSKTQIMIEDFLFYWLWLKQEQDDDCFYDPLYDPERCGACDMECDVEEEDWTDSL